MQDKVDNNKYDYSSTTKTHDHEPEDRHKQPQHMMRPFTMQDLDKAINQHKRGKVADTRGVNAEMIKYSIRRLTKQLLRLTPTSPLTCQRSNDQAQEETKTFATTVQQSHQTKRSTATTLVGHDDQSQNKSGCTIITGAHHVHAIICRLFSTHPSASSSSSVYNPHQTPTSPLTKHSSDQATPRQNTCSRSSNSVRATEWRSHRHSGAQQRADSHEGSRHRGTTHTTATREALRHGHHESKHFHLERGTNQGDLLT